jgi:hypothetical protein
MAALLQCGKTLRLIRRGCGLENSSPLAHRRSYELRNFSRIPKRLEVNVANQKRGEGSSDWRHLVWRMIRCDRLAALRKGSTCEQDEAYQRNLLYGCGAEDAGCKIPFHRCSLASGEH